MSLFILLYQPSKFPHQLQKFPLKATLNWRQQYSNKIYLENEMLVVENNYPWYSPFGIYNHFKVETAQKNTTLQYVPRFLFGLPAQLLEKQYPSSESIPTRGLMTKSSMGDRIIIQIFMSAVAVSVVVLLKLNTK